MVSGIGRNQYWKSSLTGTRCLGSVRRCLCLMRVSPSLRPSTICLRTYNIFFVSYMGELTVWIVFPTVVPYFFCIIHGGVNCLNSVPYRCSLFFCIIHGGVNCLNSVPYRCSLFFFVSYMGELTVWIVFLYHMPPHLPYVSAQYNVQWWSFHIFYKISYTLVKIIYKKNVVSHMSPHLLNTMYESHQILSNTWLLSLFYNAMLVNAIENDDKSLYIKLFILQLGELLMFVQISRR